LPIPVIFKNSLGLFSNISSVLSPNFSTIFCAVKSPIPFIKPEDKKYSISPIVLGRSISYFSIFN